MGDQLAFSEQNTERILAVQGLFGALGKPLAKPGRVLVGEGHLLKLCRRSPQPKAFFLFNDILVYGSVVILGRWYTKQQVVPLEDVSLEDTEDGLDMKNQWLIRTPRKSFYVSAASPEEKQAWMEHIEECRAERLRHTGRATAERFAAVWVPDRASAICMRCCARFSLAQRRHHCRRCGFVVCATCSKARFLIPHISPKPVRVCQPCHDSLWSQASITTETAIYMTLPSCMTQPGSMTQSSSVTQSSCITQPGSMTQSSFVTQSSCGSTEGNNSSDNDEEPPCEPSSGEDNDGHGYEDTIPSQWESQNHVRKDSWSPYVDLNDLHISDLGNF